MQLLETMLSRWLVPNVVTYSLLISAFANGERAEQALQLFGAMKSQWITSDVITYNSLVSAGAKSERAEQTMQSS